MKLQEIFDLLGQGEFSQLSIGKQEPGVINEENYAQVVNNVNLGLVALYTRFNLKQNRLTLELQDGMSTYKLQSPWAVNARRSKETPRYIIDTAAAPFADDIIKVEKVLVDGEPWPLNDATYDDSITTPSMLTLHVPSGIAEDPQIEVVYRAYHPKLASAGDCCATGDVSFELPYSHVEALLYFIASRVHNPIGMAGDGAMSNNYFGRYEAACMALEEKGIQIDQGASNDRLARGGWV